MVVDGNFTADHLKMKNAHDDVALTDGDGYMVQEGPYQQHLEESPEVEVVGSPIPPSMTE
jgi:hypothetical protein